MTDIIEKNRLAIAEVCRRYGVTRLDVFGSSLRDDFGPDENDLDLLVEFRTMESYSRVDAYFGLLEELKSLLGTKVHLIMAGAVKNPYIAIEIEQTRKMLYAA